MVNPLSNDGIPSPATETGSRSTRKIPHPERPQAEPESETRTSNNGIEPEDVLELGDMARALSRSSRDRSDQEGSLAQPEQALALLGRIREQLLAGRGALASHSGLRPHQVYQLLEKAQG